MIVVESSEMKQIEENAVRKGVALSSLMEKAGAVTAELAAKLMFEKKISNVCIICGSGNNGGDGFVAARLLSVMNCGVNVILADGEPGSELAKMNYSLLPEKVEVIAYFNRQIECVDMIQNSDLIIDAVFGIGFHGMLDPDAAQIIELCNENKKAVKISVDIPSGAECDTGAIKSVCFKADYTISFTALKPAHLLYPAMDYCGEISVANVGIPNSVLKNCGYVMETTDIAVKDYKLVERPLSANKGSYGTLLSVCGSFGMAGAALMANTAALRCGTGLVKAAIPGSVYPVVAPSLQEAVFLPLPEDGRGTIDKRAQGVLSDALMSADALLIGCGLGRSEGVESIVSYLVENSPKPLIIDADGINAIDTNIDVLRRKSAPVIITPHPGEMARLLGSNVESVQNHRMTLAKNFATEYGVVVVLKGANTIIASPSGRTYVNRTGNKGMAKAGSGDILAGMIGALLAQGVSPDTAAVTAVYYHGLCGDRCRERLSRSAMLARDIIDELSKLSF